MIKLEDLSYSFPKKDLYDKISFTLEHGNHCAFIGVSGSGKSTLLDIILNPDNYMYDGILEVDPHCTIGYVRQFSQDFKSQDITVAEFISFDYNRLQNEIAEICKEMETATDLDLLLERYQSCLDAVERIGGDSFESTMNKKLNLASLMKYKDLNITQLSGGEFKLIQVIKEMLDNPDLLIMDEPDVFLDFENINGLKHLINSHKGMLLIITHNRYLLNHCFNKIIHLENTQLQEFDGNFIDYNFELLEKKIELQELASIDTAEVERNEALINKLRTMATENAKPTTGGLLKARVKILDRLETRRIKIPFLAIAEPDIRIMTDKRLDDTLAISATSYTAAFEDVLLDSVDFEINATDKVAIIGANGTGKTTLLNAIFANKTPSIKVHEDIDMAYLSQGQNNITNEKNTIIDEFFDIGFKSYDDIHDYLDGYGFDTRKSDPLISKLSGGEKNILQLAKIAAGNANFLLLDEPTSHLDTYSQMALEKALINYNGGIIMISHDFYSIVNCMDFVLIIEDNKIRKTTMKRFKRMVYARHFDRDYLEIEENKKEVETKIFSALEKNDFEEAKVLAEELKNIIELM